MAELDPSTHLPEEEKKSADNASSTTKPVDANSQLFDVFNGSEYDPLESMEVDPRDKHRPASGLTTSTSYTINNPGGDSWFAPSKLEDIEDYLGAGKGLLTLPTTASALDKELAASQSWTSEARRTVGNLVPNIVAGVVENVGYIGTLATEWGDERDYSNALTEWAKKNRNPFGEIYRENPNKVIDLTDSAWWFEQGGGLVESIGEFLATGYGVGGLLGKGASALAKGIAAESAMLAEGLAGAAQLGTAATLAYTEGAMSGATVFQEVYKSELAKLKAVPGVTEQEAEKLAKHKAAESAAHTVQINTVVNTALNFTSVAPMFTTQSLIRKAEQLGINRMAGESTKKYVARLNTIMGEGVKKSPYQSLFRYGGEAAQESAEELTNVVSESFGKQKGGLEDEKSVWETIAESATSDEGILSMALGALGGIGQTGMMRSLPLHRVPAKDSNGKQIMKDGKPVYERMNTRQIERMNEEAGRNQYIKTLTDDFQKIEELQQELAKAAQEKNDIEVNRIKRELKNVGMYRSIQNGTAAELKQTFQEIANLSPEEAVKRGFAQTLDDESYKALAKEAMEDIDVHQKEFEKQMTLFKYGNDEALGMGKAVFDMWSRKRNLEKHSKNLEEENVDYRADMNTTNDSGAFEVINELLALENEEDARKAKLAKAEEMNKTPEGKAKLERKYAGLKLKDANAIVKFLRNKVDEVGTKRDTAKQKYDEAFASFMEEAENDDNLKDKTDEEKLDAFQEVVTNNATSHRKIAENKAWIKLYQDEISELGRALTEITSAKGRKEYRKKLTEELENQSKRAIKRATKSARRKKTKEDNQKANNAAKKPEKVAVPDTATALTPEPDEQPTPGKSDKPLSELVAEQKARQASEGKASVTPKTETEAQAIDAAAEALQRISELQQINDTGPTNESEKQADNILNEGVDEELEAINAAIDATKGLINALAKIDSVDYKDFNQVTVWLVNNFGEDVVRPLYTSFRNFYLTGIGKPDSIEDYQFEDIYKTADDRRMVSTSDAINKDTDPKHGFDTIQEYEAVLDRLKDSIRPNLDQDGRYTDSKGRAIGLGRLVVPAASALAYLTQSYERAFMKRNGVTFVEKTTDSNELLFDMQEPLLLSPDHYQPGQKLTLKVDKMFQATRDDGSEINYDMLAAEGEDFVPIGVYNQDGKLVAYVHTPSWIDTDTTADIENNIQEQRELVKAIRKQVIENGPITTTIDSKTNGNLMHNVDREFRSTNEAFPDPQLKIAIGKDGVAHVTDDLQVNIKGGEIINKEELIDGVPYAIVPTAVKGSWMAIPLNTAKVTDAYAESMLIAMEIFLKNKENVELSEAEQTVLKELTTNGFDITTESGLSKFVNKYVFTKHLNAAEQLRIGQVREGNRKYIDVRTHGVTWQSNNVGASTATNLTKFYNNRQILKDHLTAMYMNIRLEDFKEGGDKFQFPVITRTGEDGMRVTNFNGDNDYRQFVKEHTVTSLNSVKIGDNQWAYFSQPTITFDSSFAKDSTTASPSSTTEKNPIGDFTNVTPSGVPLFTEDGFANPESWPEGSLGRKQAQEELDEARKEGEKKSPPKRVKKKIGGIVIDTENMGQDPDKQVKNRQEDDPFAMSETVLKNIQEDLKSVKIPGWSPFKQKQVIGMVNGIVMNLLKESEKEKGNTSVKLSDAYNDVYEFLLDTAKDLKENNQETAYNNYLELIQNFDELVNISKGQLRSLGIIVTKGEERGAGVSIEVSEEQAKEIDESTQDILNEAGSDYAKTSYLDEISFMLDSKNSMSTDIKKMLAFIPEGKSYLGGLYYRRFDQVVNHLSSVLSGVDYDYNAMLEALREDAKKNEWVQEVITILEGRPAIKGEGAVEQDALPGVSKKLKNEFVTWASKSFSNFNTTLIEYRPVRQFNDVTKKWDVVQSPDGKGALISAVARVINTNQNDVEHVIKRQWVENLKKTALVTFNEDGTEIIINKEEASNLLAEFKDLAAAVKAKEDNLLPRVQEWLAKMGVEVSMDVLQEVEENTRKHFKVASFSGLFNHRNGAFNLMASKLDGAEEVDMEKPLAANNPLVDNGGINTLVALEAKYNPHYQTNSHRNGENKTVYSFTMNSALTHRVRELKADDGKLVNELKTHALTEVKVSVGNITGRPEVKKGDSNSSWLEGLMMYRDPDTDEMVPVDSYFRDTFSISYADTMKKKGQDKGKKLNKMSAKEIEVDRINKLGNQGQARFSETDSKTKRYVGKFQAPTHSDKTTAPIITAVKHTVKMSFNGDNFQIGESTMNEILKIGKAEFSRINFHKKNTKQYNEDGTEVEETGYIGDTIDGYKDGAELFYFFPSLNKSFLETSEEHAEDFAVLYPDGELAEVFTPEVQRAMKNIIEKDVRTLIDSKLDSWLAAGIIRKSPMVNAKGEVIEGREFYHISHIDKDYAEAIVDEMQIDSGNDFTKHRAKAIASDFVINYLIANANYMQIIAGDPAMFFKGKPDGSLESVESTWDNISKRLAGEIAPGHDIANKRNEKYLQLFLKDDKVVSRNIKEIENRLKAKGVNAQPYKEIKNADAQEYTTGLEHLEILFAVGKVEDNDYLEIKRRLKKGEKLGDELLKIILQPMKPVYVRNVIVPGVMQRKVYIKSSSFPLIPELTQGLEIDSLRVAMEDLSKKNADQGVRAVFKTGSKVGSSNVTKWQSITPENIGGLATSLPRSGFRIQQELPHDEYKAKITKGSQETNLLFANILNVGGFQYKGEKTGEQLYQEYTKVHEFLYKKASEDLKKELTDENNKIDKKKLHTLLRKEALERGYSISDIKSLDLQYDSEGNVVDFKIPLWANNSANKFESLLTSIVSNRVTKMKLPGWSAALGSEAGFVVAESEEGRAKIADNGIVATTDGWKVGDELQPMRTVDGKVLPGQILAPFKIKDNDGNPISIDQISTRDEEGRLVLDTSKVDKSILETLGFRIPTQGHNSMTYVEIVGFLPESMGDLVIASQDLVAQMGSDFDIDKLYAYMYNTNTEFDYTVNKEDNERIYQDYNRWQKENPEGTREQYASITDGIAFFRDPNNMDEGVFIDTETNPAQVKSIKRYDGEDEVKLAQNELLAMHFAVMKNSDDTVQFLIREPLEFGDLKKDGERDMLDVVAERWSEKNKARPNVAISSEHQTKMFFAGRAGQTGIGVFSVDSNFNAIAQRVKLESTVSDGEGGVKPYPISFEVEGKPVSSSNFSDTHTVTGQPNSKRPRFKSQVIAGFQSASVDNANELILNRLNINNVTFNAYSAYNQLGWEEAYSVGVMTQDIMLELVEEYESMTDSLSDVFSATALEDAINNVRNRYLEKAPEEMKVYNEDKSLNIKETQENVIFKKWLTSKEDLEDSIIKGPEHYNYLATQLRALQSFKRANDIGEQLQKVKSSVNTASKHLGKSLIETTYKEDQVAELLGNKRISGASDLLGNFTEVGNKMAIEPTTIQGFATVYGLQMANELYQDLYPYEAPGVADVMDEIVEISGMDKDNATRITETKRAIFNSVKAFLLSKDLSEFDENGNQVSGIIDSNSTTVAQERTRLFYDRLDTAGMPKVYLPFSSDNLDAIDRGSKTTTLRSSTFANKVGLEVGETGIIVLNGKTYEVTHRGPKTLEEMGGAQEVVKSEGLTTSPVGKSTIAVEVGGETYYVQHAQTKAFLEGKKVLHHFDIRPSTEAKVLPSLASRVQKFVQTQVGKDNPLATLLETDIDLTGKRPSLVTYNAANAENMDEGELHAALGAMLESDDQNIRILAQDLITYNLLAGGVQGATNIIKYIPPSYITGMGVGDKLRLFQSQFNTPTIFGGLPNGFRPDNFMSAFALQYIQHNPNLAPKLNKTRQDKYYDSKNNIITFPEDVITDSRENSLLVARMNEKGESIYVFPEVLAIYDANHPKNYRLYRRVTETTEDGATHYVEIDTAGFKKGVAEFNGDASQVLSENADNQAKPSFLPGEAVIKPEVVKIKNKSKKTDPNLTKPSDNFDKHGLKDINTQNFSGRDKAIEAMDSIFATGEQVGARIMAGLLASGFRNNPQIKLDIQLGDGKFYPGTVGENGEPKSQRSNARVFFAGINHTIMDNYHTVAFHTKFADHPSAKIAERLMVHEFTHTLTVDELDKNPVMNQAITDIRESLLDQISAGKFDEYHLGDGYYLTKETLDEFTKMVKLRKQGRDKTKSEKTDEERIADDYFKEFMAVPGGTPAGRVLYSLFNNQEFVAQAMSDGDFQVFLNQVPYPGSNKTLFDKFIDVLTDLFSRFTLPDGSRVNDNSALRATIEYTVAIINPSTDPRGGQPIPSSPITPPTPKPVAVEINTDRWTADTPAKHPDKTYVFGDNTQRRGTGGTAVIRNNRNVSGIATKKAPGREDSDFFTDDEFEANKNVIDGDIQRLKDIGGTLVFPKGGFGTDLAALKDKAPKTFNYLSRRLKEEFNFHNPGFKYVINNQTIPPVPEGPVSPVVQEPMPSNSEPTTKKFDPDGEIPTEPGTYTDFNNPTGTVDNQQEENNTPPGELFQGGFGNVNESPFTPDENNSPISDDEYNHVRNYIVNTYLRAKGTTWYNGKQYPKEKLPSASYAHRLARQIAEQFPWLGVRVHHIENGKARVELYDNRAYYAKEQEQRNAKSRYGTQGKFNFDPFAEAVEETATETEEETVEEEDTGVKKGDTIPKVVGPQAVINYHKARLYSINKAISRFKGTPQEAKLLKRRDDVEALLDRIKDKATFDEVVKVAQAEMSNVYYLLDQAMLGADDYKYLSESLNDILQSVGFWKDALGSLFHPDELNPIGVDDTGNLIFSPAVTAMKEIIAEAQTAKNQVVNQMRHHFVKMAKETPGVPAMFKDLTVEQLEQFEDIDTFLANFVDISRMGNPVLAITHKWMKDATNRTNDEGNKIFSDLEKVVEKVKETAEFRSDGFKLFAQRDAEGNLTGNMATRFSHEFYSERAARRRAAANKGTKAAWESYFNWKKKNEIVFDLRKIFFEDYIVEGAPKFTEADKEAHEQELRDQLGDAGFDKLMADISSKYKRYKDLKEATETDLKATEPSAIIRKQKMAKWEAKYSPFKYAEVVVDGNTKANVFGSGKDARFIKPEGWRYTESVPRRIVDGKETDWYDAAFESIEGNESLEQFYYFFTDTVNQLMDYLPESVTDRHHMNTIPELRRGLMERIFEQKSLKAGFVGIHDAIMEELTSDDDTDMVKHEVDVLTQQPIASPTVRMLDKTIPAEEKSYDLDKVLKSFAAMALAYKHKSRVEDQIRLANQIIENALEISTNAKGDKLKRSKLGEVLLGKDGLSELAGAMRYATEAFYGQKKKPEGVSERKLLTWEERDRKKNAEERIAEIDEQLENGEITDKEYDTLFAAIDEEFGYSQLGRNLTGSRVGDAIIKYVQLKGMGWNVFSAVTNMLYGGFANVIHANGRADFDLKQLRQALSVMLHATGSNLTGGYGNTATSNKVRNLMVKYDVLKEFNEEAHKTNDNANKNRKGLKKLAPYELQRSSEYFVQGQQMVAMLMATGLDGKKLTAEEIAAGKTSMWEAYGEDGNLKEEFSGNKDWEGDPNEEGSNILRYQLKNRLDQVLKATHGNYDPDSAVKIKKTVAGRFLMQFRSWVAEGWQSRMEEEKADLYMGRQRKGRYRTLYELGIGGSLATLAKQAMYNKKAFETKKKSGEELSEVDIENMRKNLAELTIYLSLGALALALKGIELDDDDDAGKLVVNFMLNQTFRLENDIAFYTSPMAFEAISRNAIPAFSLIADTYKFVGAVFGYVTGDDEIEAGKNAGESRLARATGKILPFSAQMYKLKTATEYLYER